MYTVVDIIDKLIEVKRKSLSYYRMLNENSKIEPRVKFIANVFAREEERQITLFEEIKTESLNLEDIQIDFHIYDSITKVFVDFKRGLHYTEAYDIRELLLNALDLSQKNLALVIRIQGMLVRKKEHGESNSYNVLTKMIKAEEDQINNIKTFIQ